MESIGYEILGLWMITALGELFPQKVEILFPQNWKMI